MRPALSTALVAAALIYAIFGCGYRTVDTTALPGGIKTLSIPVFKNESDRADVETIVTNAVVNEFMRSVDVVGAGEGDAVIVGTVKAYKLSPVSFTAHDVASTYRVSIVLSIKLVKDGEVLWQDDNITDYEDFAVNTANVLTTKQSEWALVKKMATDSARRVKERIFGGI